MNSINTNKINEYWPCVCIYFGIKKEILFVSNQEFFNTGIMKNIRSHSDQIKQ